jgi:hypothetical protein
MYYAITKSNTRKEAFYYKRRNIFWSGIAVAVVAAVARSSSFIQPRPI